MKSDQRKKIAECEERIKDIPESKRVYVDEAGFTSYLYRQYARLPKGEKVHESIRGNKYQRMSIVAGQLGREIIAPFQYNGTMNGDFFETRFEEHLLPEIPKDAVIILDNASFHRKKRLFDIAGKYNRTVIFLPPYSPEFDPIEHFWHWLKKQWQIRFFLLST